MNARKWCNVANLQCNESFSRVRRKGNCLIRPRLLLRESLASTYKSPSFCFRKIILFSLKSYRSPIRNLVHQQHILCQKSIIFFDFDSRNVERFNSFGFNFFPSCRFDSIFFRKFVSRRKKQVISVNDLRLFHNDGWKSFSKNFEEQSSKHDCLVFYFQVFKYQSSGDFQQVIQQSRCLCAVR